MDGLTEPIASNHVQSILAIGLLIIYCVVQIYCIIHAGSADDIISARLQDVLIMVVSYYFGSSKDKQK